MKRKRLWGVLALCVGLGCGAGSAWAATAVDFAREATNRWTVSPAPPAGIRVAEDGLSVRFERARLQTRARGRFLVRGHRAARGDV